jgi:hypothetical protein
MSISGVMLGVSGRKSLEEVGLGVEGEDRCTEGEERVTGMGDGCEARVAMGVEPETVGVAE